MQGHYSKHLSLSVHQQEITRNHLQKLVAHYCILSSSEVPKKIYDEKNEEIDFYY